MGIEIAYMACLCESISLNRSIPNAIINRGARMKLKSTRMTKFAQLCCMVMLPLLATSCRTTAASSKDTGKKSTGISVTDEPVPAQKTKEPGVEDGYHISPETLKRAMSSTVTPGKANGSKDPRVQESIRRMQFGNTYIDRQVPSQSELAQRMYGIHPAKHSKPAERNSATVKKTPTKVPAKAAQTQMPLTVTQKKK
jgi:hypothetical protein